MSIPAEALLLVVAIAFYLFDSMMLLYNNDVVFVRTRFGWQASTGSSLQFRGRYIFLPNVLTPHDAIFRSQWTWQKPSAGPEHLAGLDHFVAALKPLRRGCVALWVLLFVALPALLMMYSHPVALMALLGFLYLTVAGMIVSAYRYRRALQLSNRDIALLALDGFACPPFAINFVRKVSLKREIRESALSFASRVMVPNELANLRVAIVDRVSASIDFEDDESPRREALIDFRKCLRDGKS